jgi:hypothetical protein
VHERLAEELTEKEDDEGFDHARSVGPARGVCNLRKENPGRWDRGSQEATVGSSHMAVAALDDNLLPTVMMVMHHHAVMVATFLDDHGLLSGSRDHRQRAEGQKAGENH